MEHFPALASFTYDPLSLRTQLTLANGTTTTYTFDAVSRLKNLIAMGPAQPQGPVPLFSLTYTYDPLGNRKTLTDAAGLHTYTYDSLSQLTKADHPASFPFADTTFTLDPVGNRTKTVNGGTTTYTPNSLNQYTQLTPPGGSPIPLTYDTKGNLTQGPSSQGTAPLTLTYDSENRLLTASCPATETDTALTATYTYDPFGRRISKTVNGLTTRFLYDGDQILAETDAAGNITAKYAYGPGIDEPLRMTVSGTGTVPDTDLYYHADGLGSIRRLSGSSGEPSRERYVYDAFGTPMAVVPGFTGEEVALPIDSLLIQNRLLFTGREFDPETGLYHYRARTYHPSLGRFLQRDPKGYVDGPNPYTYTGNNPLNFTDPWGLKKQELSWWEWWLLESVVPGPYGQPKSEWGPSGPTEWGDPMKYTEAATPPWKWAERIAVGTATAATAAAAGSIAYEAGTAIRIEFHLPHKVGPHRYPHLQIIKGPGWGKTLRHIPRRWPWWWPKRN